MNIFEQYGIREVVNATLYSIHRKKDGSDELFYIPTIHLDTLKISSSNTSSECVWQTGGEDNSRLIPWDYGKTIDINLQDALFSPSSLSMCHGEELYSKWENSEVKINSSIEEKINVFENIEQVFYNRPDGRKHPIGSLLSKNYDDENFVINSSTINNIKINGTGVCNNHSFNWILKINSYNKSLGQIPDRFYDNYGKMYNIDQNNFFAFNLDTPTYHNYKDAIIYKIKNNKPQVDNIQSIFSNQIENDVYGSVIEPKEELDTCAADYICVIIDNNNDYKVLVGRGDNKLNWYKPKNEISSFIFKKIVMWNKFDNLNELVYYLITNFKSNIKEIPNDVIWSYINPKTMQPYKDDYWFSQGEKYLIKKLVISKNNLKAKKISINSKSFSGMYMFRGETYIRSKETLEDKHIQITIPYCKLICEQEINLSPDGEPVVINLKLQVGKPYVGPMMEFTTYSTEEFKIDNENIDNSKIIKSE